MPYNTMVQRSDVTARIPQRIVDDMLTTLEAQSALLNLGTRIPMPVGVTSFPVLSALPTAYWVTGDTGMKQTSGASWGAQSINVDELAVIVPVPENVLDDAGFDIWGALRPLMEQAIARAIDQAAFLGVNKPATQPVDFSTAANTAGNTVVRGTATAANGGLAKDISDLIALMEAEGESPNAGIARIGLKGIIRGLSAQQVTAVSAAMGAGGAFSINDWWGVPVSYDFLRGLWPTAVSTVEAIIGDFTKVVVGVRRDFTYKLITEGVITDNSTPPVIQFNLPQQDMVALRVTFRLGWQINNPINYDQPVAASRYPFGRLVRTTAG
jgi:HK97 family phage major capsid protein